MNEVLMEQLLHEGESSSLDYKRDQYLFGGASDEDKGELLKDILAFANGWRHAEAYILIGVDEVAGGRSNVVGVSNHIPENDLQQFVNSKTNRPVTFSYRAFPFEGKQVGIITIPQQDRPIYLSKNFGKLQRQIVYYRQGTTTAIATPDDIARMGSGHSSMKEASLVVEFAHTKQEVSLGNQISWSAEFCRMPQSEDIQTIGKQKSQVSHSVFGIPIPSIPSYGLHDRLNRHYFHELAEYEFCKRLFRKVRLVVSNTGDAPASDVRIEMSIPTKQGIIILSPSKFPRVPKRQESILGMSAMRDLKLRPAFRHAGDVDIDENEHRFKIEVECGNLQPGRQVWSDEFYVGISSSGQVELDGLLLSDNLPGPQDFTLRIDAKVSEREMTVGELVSLCDPVDDAED